MAVQEPEAVAAVTPMLVQAAAPLKETKRLVEDKDEDEGRFQERMRLREEGGENADVKEVAWLLKHLEIY
jgi:hypothetical protein